MNDDLRELYQEIIVEHSRKPRNFHKLPAPAQHLEGYNPLCGDRMTVYLHMDDDVVRDISFEGSGCAISTASASVMTEVLKGKTRAEAEKLFDRFHRLITGEADAVAEAAGLGKLAVFAGVSQFPSRVKCAVLAWHTMHAALEGEQEPVSTE